MLFQKAAGEELTGKDTAGIHTAAQKRALPFQETADRGQQTSCPINREHPDGGPSDQSEFFSFKGMQGCEYNLHAPAHGAAYNKFVLHGKKYV